MFSSLHMFVYIALDVVVTVRHFLHYGLACLVAILPMALLWGDIWLTGMINDTTVINQIFLCNGLDKNKQCHCFPCENLVWVHIKNVTFWHYFTDISPICGKKLLVLKVLDSCCFDYDFIVICFFWGIWFIDKRKRRYV